MSDDLTGEEKLSEAEAPASPSSVRVCPLLFGFNVHDFYVLLVFEKLAASLAVASQACFWTHHALLTIMFGM